MAAKQVFLEYGREGALSSGVLILQEDELTISTTPFTRVTFKEMLRLLAVCLSTFGDARVVLRRSDAPNLFPYVLDQQTVDLFRTDPLAAIQSMTFELPSSPRIAKPDKAIEVLPLRVGYDTLSDAFGETIYVRARNETVECPVCGLWLPVKNGEILCDRRCPSIYLPQAIPVTVSSLWAGVSVEKLLSLPVDRFFLPRPWNGPGDVWISRSELHNKYTAYKAEKATACKALATV